MRISVCVWERAREGLCERENNEIDEDNVRDEKWTEEWKKSGLRKIALHEQRVPMSSRERDVLPREGCPRQPTKNDENDSMIFQINSRKKREVEAGGTFDRSADSLYGATSYLLSATNCTSTQIPTSWS